MKIVDRIIKSRKGIELLGQLPQIHSLFVLNHTQNPEISVVLFPNHERPLNSAITSVNFIREITKDDFSPSKIMPCISLLSASSKSLDQEVGFYKDSGIECVVVTASSLNDSKLNADSDGYKDLATLTKEIKKISPNMRVITNTNHVGIRRSQTLDQRIEELKNQINSGTDAIMTHTFNHGNLLDFKSRCQESGINIPVIPSVIPLGNPKYLFDFALNTDSHMPVDIPMILFSRKGLTSEDSFIRDEYVEDRLLRYNAGQINSLSFDFSAINLHVADNAVFLNKLLSKVGLVKAEGREI